VLLVNSTVLWKSGVPESNHIGFRPINFAHHGNLGRANWNWSCGCPPPHGILADRAWGGGIGYRGTFGTGGYPVPAGYRAPAGTRVRPYPHGYPGQRRRPPPAGAPAGATSVRRSAQTTVGRFWGALASAAGRATAPHPPSGLARVPVLLSVRLYR